MSSDNIAQTTFRRMLAREAGTDANAPAIAAAASRLCDRLAEQLTPLVGDAGVAAICARSVHLVEGQFPALAPLLASDEREAPFARLLRSLERQSPAAATEAAIAVLASVAGLLMSFIGEDLTTRLLHDAWPDDLAGDTTEATTAER